MKEFIYILNEKLDYETELAKGLRKINDFNYAITKEGSLGPAIASFKSHLQDHMELLAKANESVRCAIIEPMKDFLEGQISESRKHHNIIKTIEEEFKQTFYSVEKTKVSFHSLARAAEESKVQCEIARANPSLKSDHKQKFLQKSQTLTKEAKESENVYIQNIQQSNIFKDYYISKSSESLQRFQAMEEEYIDYMRTVLIKYNAVLIEMNRGLLESLGRNVGVYEQVDPGHDIKAFIEGNQTNFLPPYKFEFMPYISQLDNSNLSSFIQGSYSTGSKDLSLGQIGELGRKVDQTKANQELISHIRNFIKETFHSEIPETKNPAELKIQQEIRHMVNSAWDAKELGSEEKNQFLKYIKSDMHRRYFLTSLNKYRIEGLFILDDLSFSLIADMLNKILDVSFQDKDFWSVKFCMILSQTFFKVDKALNSESLNPPRIFLQAGIDKHACYRDIESWEEMIRLSIKEEMNSPQAMRLYVSESSEEKALRLTNIAYGQLFSFAFNMMVFSHSKDSVKEVIKNFTKAYNIREDLSQQIYSLVNEFNSDVHESVSNDLIEENKAPISEEDHGEQPDEGPPLGTRSSGQMQVSSDGNLNDGDDQET